MDIRIESVPAPSEALVESVNAILRRHNQHANPALWEAREHEENLPRPVHLFARGGAGDIVGGLLGTTQFAWLKIDIMAVLETSRGAGIGCALLEEAERMARERGCKYAYVDTMGYQAPDFYRKAGYAAAGQLPNWDSFGHTKFFFVKDLFAENS